MKGITLLTSEVLQTLAIFALIIFVIFLFKGSYFDLNIIVNEHVNERWTITLSQILMSSQRITVNQPLSMNEEEKEYRIMRGVLDSRKLDILRDYEDARNNLYKEISYPNTKYLIKIKDLKTGQVWIISPGIVSAKSSYTKKFPLAIWYSDDTVNIGVMELTLYVI